MKVFSWQQALDEGLNPSDYSYSSDSISEGTHEAVLDFKIWSKKVMGIDCFFTKPLAASYHDGSDM